MKCFLFFGFLAAISPAFAGISDLSGNWIGSEMQGTFYPETTDPISLECCKLHVVVRTEGNSISISDLSAATGGAYEVSASWQFPCLEKRRTIKAIKCPRF